MYKNSVNINVKAKYAIIAATSFLLFGGLDIICRNVSGSAIEMVMIYVICDNANVAIASRRRSAISKSMPSISSQYPLSAVWPMDIKLKNIGESPKTIANESEKSSPRCSFASLTIRMIINSVDPKVKTLRK